MSVSWKQCEGQVINNTFPLQKYLGGSGDSGVFLTQLSGPEPVKAAIKLLPASDSSDLQLSLWRRASQLSHPNLIRLLQCGRCQLANSDLLYVVMEYAEEDLSQILPERPLTPDEAKQMLEPAIAALAHLHSQGLVHSHVKPSNVLATGDQLKLSSDSLFPVGEARRVSAKLDPYAAPESARLPFSPAADAWSVGITAVAALTQRTPSWQHGQQNDPTVPENIPQPFLDIARHTLRIDPKLRWTIAQISTSLNPVAVAAAAAQSVSPLAIPVSPVPAVPAAKLQAPKPVQPVRKAQAPAPQPVSQPGQPKQALVLPNYVIPLAAAVLVIAGILVLPRVLGRRAETPSATPTANSAAPAASAPSEPKSTPQTSSSAAVPAVTKPAARPAAPSSPTTSKDTSPSETAANPPATTTPASLRTESVPTPSASNVSTGGPARGEILDQVLPQASEKALATIQGAVRVTVLLQVDAAGNVSQSELDSPGPSKYFADLALNASRRWEFTSPEVDGHSVPSQWQVRFEFSQSGVKAFPKQIAP